MTEHEPKPQTEVEPKTEKELRLALVLVLQQAKKISGELVELRTKAGLATHQEALTNSQISEAIRLSGRK